MIGAIVGLRVLARQFAAAIEGPFGCRVRRRWPTVCQPRFCWLDRVNVILRIQIRSADKREEKKRVAFPSATGAVALQFVRCEAIFVGRTLRLPVLEEPHSRLDRAMFFRSAAKDLTLL
jgi:hypothetical protein